MAIQKAFCIQSGTVVDIFEAQRLYFEQPEPRRRFTFECADEDCRNALHPTVTGAMYDRELDDGVSSKRMMFKWGPESTHLSSCPDLEIREALQQVAAEARSGGYNGTNRSLTFEGIDPEDVPDVLILDPEEQIRTTKASDEETRTIRSIPDRTSRIRAYARHFGRRSVESGRLEAVVDAFEAMTHYERRRAKLQIAGIGRLSYAEMFRETEDDLIPDLRIYHGNGRVARLNLGYMLNFFGHTDVKGEPGKARLFLSNRTLASSRNRLALIDKLKQLNGSADPYARAYVLGTARSNGREDSKGRQLIDVSPHSPDLIVLRLVSKLAK